MPIAGHDDLDEALEAADRGFKAWKAVSAFERSKILRKAANLMRERVEEIARIMTLEQGKPLAEAKGETLARRRHRSTGSPRRRAAPMAASSRPARTA